MTYPAHRSFFVSSMLLALLTATACGDSGPPENVIDICNFPEDIPSISILLPAPDFNPPVIQSGQDIDTSVAVNSATRLVRVELRDPFSEAPPANSLEIPTGGGEVVRVRFPTDGITGRYYLRIILCGDNCNARSVSYEITPPEDTGNPTLPMEYDRVIRENGVVTVTEDSCVDLNTVGVNG